MVSVKLALIALFALVALSGADEDSSDWRQLPRHSWRKVSVPNEYIPGLPNLSKIPVGQFLVRTLLATGNATLADMKKLDAFMGRDNGQDIQSYFAFLPAAAPEAIQRQPANNRQDPSDPWL